MMVLVLLMMLLLATTIDATRSAHDKALADYESELNKEDK
jgi:hypothetical protein